MCLRHKQTKIRSMSIWNPVSEYEPSTVQVHCDYDARIILTWEVELGEVGWGFRNGYHSDVISPQVQHLTRRKRNLNVSNSLQNFQASPREKKLWAVRPLFRPLSTKSAKMRPQICPAALPFIRPLLSYAAERYRGQYMHHWEIWRAPNRGKCYLHLVYFCLQPMRKEHGWIIVLTNLRFFKYSIMCALFS